MDSVNPLTSNWREDARRAKAAIRTLEGLGYSYKGGDLWWPPLGRRPLRFHPWVLAVRTWFIR